MEIIILLFILGSSLGAGTLVVRNLYYICQPSEILIFAGPERTSQGKKLGYRLVKGSASIRVPLLERALRMDLTVPVAVEPLRNSTRSSAAVGEAELTAARKSPINRVIFSERLILTPEDRKAMQLDKAPLTR